MNEQTHTSESLIDEVTRYLAVVDAFRTAGCEPTWRPESAPPASAQKPAITRPNSVPLDLGLH